MVRSEGFGDILPSKQQAICVKQIRLFCMCVITHALLAVSVDDENSTKDTIGSFLKISVPYID